jgi:hypothetical protein
VRKTCASETLLAAAPLVSLLTSGSAEETKAAISLRAVAATVASLLSAGGLSVEEEEEEEETPPDCLSTLITHGTVMFCSARLRDNAETACKKHTQKRNRQKEQLRFRVTWRTPTGVRLKPSLAWKAEKSAGRTWLATTPGSDSAKKHSP